MTDNTTAAKPQGAAAGSGASVASAMLTAVARRMTGNTTLYMVATAFVLPVGLASTIITIQYLTPAQFGELGLLMVLASFITLAYNIGILHGTFLWVYGSTGDMGDDAMDIVGQTDVASQRRGLTTGLLIAIALATTGTLIFLTFARPLSAMLLGTPKDANLIGLAALSGGAGSIFRLTTNVFRFERRVWAYGAATIARPIGVLILSTGLVVAGYGVWGAVLGTALPTIACAIGNVLVTWRNYAFAFSWHDVRQIGIRTAWVVIPLIGLNITHNCDLVLLSHWVHGAPLGVYRLASRLASPPSYFASAVLMAWSPLERTPIFFAAYQARGAEHVRSLMVTYYLIAGLTMVVVITLLSYAILVIAPSSYADAATIVPLSCLAFVVYGLYIVILRTARPHPLIPWYTGTTLICLAVFIGSGFVLIPLLGVYGAPLAVCAGCLSGSAGLLVGNLRSPVPMPVQWKRIGAATLVAAGATGAAMVGASAGHITGALIAAVALIAYFPALVLTGAIPVSHLRLLWNMIPRRSERPVRPAVETLPAAEREVVERFRKGPMVGAQPLEYARLTRGLRRLAELPQTPTYHDVRIGAYLASPDPESIRDWELREMIEEGTDPYILSHLDRVAREVRSGRLDRKNRVQPRRSALRQRLQALETRERAELLEALNAAGSTNDSAGNGNTQDKLARVRALRAIRRSLELGDASAADAAIATALWNNDGHELLPAQRDDLRVLKAASRLAAPPADAARR